MSAYKIQMPGNYPEESIQHLQHGESLKSRRLRFAEVATLPHVSEVMELWIAKINVDKAWTVYFPCGYGMAESSLKLQQCNILLEHMQYLGVIFNAGITQEKTHTKTFKIKAFRLFMTALLILPLCTTMTNTFVHNTKYQKYLQHSLYCHNLTCHTVNTV
jgi:hypothetical protein